MVARAPFRLVEVLRRANLVLRGAMELGIVMALGTWGYRQGMAGFRGIWLMLIAPLVGLGFWGLVDFRNSGRLSEPLRLTQELLVSGLAGVAWYVAGAHALGWALAVVSLVHHVMVYATGARLLAPPVLDTS